MIIMLYNLITTPDNRMCNRSIINRKKAMPLGILPVNMTPEFGNALFVIDGVALVLFVLMIYSAKIAAGSSRVSRLLGLSMVIERIRLWRAAHKSH